MHINVADFKAQIDIVDLVGRSERLVKSGDSYRSSHESAGHGSNSGTCLSVSPETQLYYCHHCGVGGDVIHWIMSRDSCDFSDALGILAEIYSIPLPRLDENSAETAEKKSVRSIIAEYFQWCHDNMTGDQRAYFHSRGITDEIVDKLLLGYAPAGNAAAQHFGSKHPWATLYQTGLWFKSSKGAVDRYQDRYLFPYRKSGQIVFSIGRSLDPGKSNKYVKHLTHNDSYPYVSQIAVDHCIYRLGHGQDVIITEGVIDAILAYQAGFSVLSPTTTRFSARSIRDLVSLTKTAETVTIINDNEASGAGKQGAMATAKALLEAGKMSVVVTLPRADDVEKIDLADYLQAHSADDLRRLIDDSPDYIESLVAEAIALPSRKKRKAVGEILKLIKPLEPVERGRYMQAIKEAKLATIGDQRAFFKGETQKTASQIAQEILKAEFTDAQDRSQLVFYADSWYVYEANHYKEWLKSEIEAVVTRNLMTDDIEVSTRLVADVLQVLAAVSVLPHTIEPPCRISTQQECRSLISMQNGVLDLDKAIRGESADVLSPHSPDLFVLSSLPYAYDPHAECHEWEDFLRYALHNEPDLRSILQEFFGLTLTHDTRWHHFLFLQGESRTGKGVTFETLEALVGHENVSAVPLHKFNDPFGMQPMIGKKLNTSTEIPELGETAENALKDYCGGATTLTINRKFKGALVTRQRAKLAFSSNHFPHFKDRSNGIWERMLLISFNRVVPEADRDEALAERIIANELPGIFNWAIEGYKRLIKRHGFTDSLTMRTMRDDYRDETTPVRRFLAECTVLDADAYTSSKDLYEVYKTWAADEGHQRQNHVTFGRDVKAALGAESGVVYRRSKAERGYQGLAIGDRW